MLVQCFVNLGGRVSHQGTFQIFCTLSQLPTDDVREPFKVEVQEELFLKGIRCKKLKWFEGKEVGILTDFDLGFGLRATILGRRLTTGLREMRAAPAVGVAGTAATGDNVEGCCGDVPEATRLRNSETFSLR